ncbi:MAG: radical SAM protein [Candidatus Omnitrophota bacterium]
MKVLITNPPGNEFKRGAGSRWPHRNVDKTAFQYEPFPFFLGITAAILEKEGYDVDFKDCVASKLDRKKFLEHVGNLAPDLVIMQTSAPSYYYDLETKKFLEMPVAAVGVHASALPLQHLQDGFDFALCGEYDMTVLELAKRIKQGTGPDKIKGVSYMKNGNFCFQGYSDVIKDLSKLPWPARHLMPMDKYNEPFACGRNVWMMSARGCGYQCIYCTIPSFWGRPSYRTRDVKDVCDEMEHIIKTYRPNEIYFDDASLTISQKHATMLSEEILNRNFHISWRCMIDPNTPPSLLDMMYQAGCRGVKLGVESGDVDVLKKIGRSSNLGNVRRVVGKCKELQMQVHATFMLGLPGETLEKAKKSVDFLLSLDVDAAQLFIATPFPGTRFYTISKENKWLISDDWSTYDGLHPIVEYPGYRAEEITKAFKSASVRWERRTVFSKPMRVIHHLRNVYIRNGFGELIRTIWWGMKRILLGL